jgi:UDP-3-O-[3-hydroxymyristoyl] glucosamine N-acyltransferase
MTIKKIYIHPTAEVSLKARLGRETKVWHQAQIRDKVKIGNNCIIGKGVYIDENVSIGNNVKIQNYASIYHTSIIEDGVFIGPHVILTNDKFPRAINPNGNLKKESDWESGKIVIKKGASVGAGSIIITDLKVGEFAMIGALSLITKDVPPYSLFYGVPGVIHGYVCKCGKIITRSKTKPKSLLCPDCSKD